MEELDERGPVLVSPITAWEIAQLTARGRITLTTNPLSWFRRLIQLPNLALTDLNPEILVASNFLPGDPPRDPADRIIAATSRELGHRLITRDRELLAYGTAGHLDVLAC